MQLATVTTLKASKAVTLAFVGYHLRIGVDHLYLYFDDPEDEAIPFLEEDERISCIRCDAQYWAQQGLKRMDTVQKRQEINATHALQQARRRDVDWVVHIDSDELLYCHKGTLRSLFNRVARDTDVLVFPVMEAAPQQMHYDHPFQGITFFKYCPNVSIVDANYTMRFIDKVRLWVRTQWWKRRKQLATLTRCTHSNIMGRYLLGHTEGKSAVRTSAPVARNAIHRPCSEAGEALQAAVAPSASVLHFDCQGFASWKSKWLRRVHREADFDASRFAPARRRQMQQIQAAVKQDSQRDLTDLYKRWYFIPEREQRILRMLGLLREVSLTPAHFAARLSPDICVEVEAE
jgi:hypothetical protein